MDRELVVPWSKANMYFSGITAFSPLSEGGPYRQDDALALLLRAFNTGSKFIVRLCQIRLYIICPPICEETSSNVLVVLTEVIILFITQRLSSRGESRAQRGVK